MTQPNSFALRAIPALLVVIASVIFASCSVFYKKETLKFYRPNGANYIDCIKTNGGYCSGSHVDATDKPRVLSVSAIKNYGALQNDALQRDIDNAHAKVQFEMRIYGEALANQAVVEKKPIAELDSKSLSEISLPDSVQGVLLAHEAVALVEYLNSAGEPGELEYEGVPLAIKVLSNDVSEEHLRLYRRITGYLPTDVLSDAEGADSDQEGTPTFRFSRKDLRQHYRDVAQVTSLDAWTPTAAFGLGQAMLLRDSLGDDRASDRADLIESRILAFEELTRRSIALGQYMKAFFRSGHIISVEVDTASLKKRLRDELTQRLAASGTLPEDKLDEIVESIMKTVAPVGDRHVIFGRIKDEAFRTRGGVEYSFPAVTASIDPLADEPYTISDIDFLQVGSDLARVFWEAVGDSIAGVPGDPKATGCKIGLLPPFKSGEYGVSDEQFVRINEHASQIEALISVSTGRLIRGISVFSLNNEALATLIETSVGVIARKATEKVLWCRYSCGRDKSSLGIKSADGGEIVEIEVGIR